MSAGEVPIEAREAQLEGIRKEVARYPLLSLAVPLDKDARIVHEMEHDGAYLAQTLSLFGASESSTRQYDFRRIRYSRRDGNCFYRCAGFRLCELLVEHPERASEYVARLKSREESLATHFGPFVSDFTDALAEIFTGAADGTIVEMAKVYQRFTSDEGAYIVAALRYLISAYLQDNADDYDPYVQGLGYATVKDYCNAEVELVDHESDNVQLAAFAAAFDVCCKVYALDRNVGGDITEYSFNDGGEGADGGRLVIELLYMPGHYNLLEH